MSNSDYLNLDGKSLQTFLLVFEHMSVSKAAEELDVTQSTVSHTLDRLREALGDSLFVRFGRGIAPTERAIALHDPIRELLDGMRELRFDRPFDPTSETLRLKIAANDYQRELIFPEIMKDCYLKGIDMRLDFIPSGVPKPSTLQEAHCDLIITPHPPEGPHLLKSLLFEDKHMCFYDARIRKPPKTMGEFLKCRHAAVIFAGNENSWVTLPKAVAAEIRNLKISLSVPHFTALPSFILGTDLVATQLSMMHKTSLSSLDTSPPPFKTEKVPVYMAWHMRDQRNPMHAWMREKIQSATAQYV